MAAVHHSGLDGVRALAVAAVFLFHAEVLGFRGGFLGVDVFFVLSGFLITGLLVTEYEKTGSVDVIRFYQRRAKRLLPALFLLLALVPIAAAIWAADALPRLRGDTLASFAYSTNWWFIFRGESYFEFTGRQPMLQHLWSLAIEEQFYLVWPAMVVVAMRFGGRRLLGPSAALLSVVSLGLMFAIMRNVDERSPQDASRAYFGTDTHAFGLLAGAALAVWWRIDRARAKATLTTKGGLVLLGLAALAGLVASFFLLWEQSTVLFPWGFAIVCGLTAILIFAAAHPASPAGRILDWGPIGWIGVRSYGIYLWHWPVFMMTRPELDLRLSEPMIFAIRVVATLVISALSYTFLEHPIRTGAIERLVARMRSREARVRRAAKRQAFASVTATLALAGVVTTILMRAPVRAAPAADVVAAMGKAAPPNPADPAGTNGGTAKPGGTETPPTPEPGAVRYVGDVLALGDSVLLGAEAMLTRSIRGLSVDAEVGRQAVHLLERVRLLREMRQLPPVVALHFGTNGYVTERQLRQILTELEDRERVIVINSRVPRRWMEPNNELIAHVVPEFKNVALADWEAISRDHPEYFVSDGIHLSVEGQRAFVGVIISVGAFDIDTSEADAKRRRALVPIWPAPYAPGDYSPTLVPMVKPTVLDSFWYDMADCETGGNWQDGGEYSGGLGIYVGTWKAFGGLEFGPKPADATTEQQIIVANRVATHGWTKPDGKVVKAVGFSGWGCLRVVGRPELLFFTTESVLAQQYVWKQKGQVVKDLQALLGLPRDGEYGKTTSEKHLKLLEDRGLPLTLAARPPK